MRLQHNCGSSRVLDLTGRRFGKLQVVRRSGYVKAGQTRVPAWFCVCDCGRRKVVRGNSLKSGNTTGCGRCKTSSNLRHGLTGTRVWSIWCSMLSRCLNPRASNYARYGGAGIKVCARWKTFENFLLDMGEPPTGHSIDRIDGSGDYRKSNCRWATAQTQSANRACARRITFRGRTLCAAEWARVVGMKHSTLLRRLQRGWSVVQALTCPVR